METPVKPLQDGELLYFGVLTACDAGKKLSNAENRIHLNQLANVGTGSYYGGNCSFKAQGLFFRIHALSGSPSACPERTLTKHLECCTALDESYHMGSYNLVLSNKAPAIENNKRQGLQIGKIHHRQMDGTIYKGLRNTEVIENIVSELDFEIRRLATRSEANKTRHKRWHGYSIIFQTRPENELQSISRRRDCYLRWIEREKLQPELIHLQAQVPFKPEVSWDPSAIAKAANKNQMSEAPVFDIRNGYGTKVFHARNAEYMPQRIDVAYTADAQKIPYYSYNRTPALPPITHGVTSRANTTASSKSAFEEGSWFKAMLKRFSLLRRNNDKQQPPSRKFHQSGAHSFSATFAEETEPRPEVQRPTTSSRAPNRTHNSKTSSQLTSYSVPIVYREDREAQFPARQQRPSTSTGAPSLRSSRSWKSRSTGKRNPTTRSSSMARPQTSGGKPRYLNESDPDKAFERQSMFGDDGTSILSSACPSFSSGTSAGSKTVGTLRSVLTVESMRPTTTKNESFDDTETRALPGSL
ncbi:hypothetical protein F5883DRAFT_225023 [Diaporthe sp. PMI_573]|nr:hypothetical protein F5883DRAFT_225023 [Diaporthaceae sp. PMI_573]